MDEQLYFNIRSKECTQVSNNADLVVNLPFSIDIADNEWLQIEVISAEIPLSFYNISSALQNNIFSYTKNFSTVSTYTIPNGNYTVDSLMTTLNALQLDFVISYSDVFNKFLISPTPLITDMTFTYNINNYWQQVYGIISNQSINSPSFFNGVVNLASVHSILVRSSLNSGNSASTAQSNNDIIQKISLDVNFGGIIIFNQNSVIRKNIIKSGSIRQFYLKLTEQNQKILDLNGCNWEISFLFSKIKHDLNEVTEEQKIRRSNNYIEPLPPVIEAPIIQPPIIQPTYQPIQQNEAVDTQPSKTLLDNNIDNNDNNDINGENLLIKNNEYSPVEPLKTNIETNEPPKPDIYDNLDSLLLSLVGE